MSEELNQDSQLHLVDVLYFLISETRNISFLYSFYILLEVFLLFLLLNVYFVDVVILKNLCPGAAMYVYVTFDPVTC